MSDLCEPVTNEIPAPDGFPCTRSRARWSDISGEWLRLLVKPPSLRAVGFCRNVGAAADASRGGDVG